MLEHDVRQEARELQPGPLAGDSGQGQEPLRHIAVVLQHPGVLAGAAVLRRTDQPGDGAHVEPHQQVRRLGGALDQVGAVEVGARLGERGDGQPVPRRDDLVVPARPGAQLTGGEQPRPHIGGAGLVRGLRRRELEHRGAFFEGALVGHREELRGEHGVLLAQYLAQLRGSPDVVGALDVLPVRVLAVGVQRGGEAALGRAQFADHEVGGLQRHATGEPGSGGAPQVGVDAAEQRVVVEHLLEVRDDPFAVHGVAGEAAAELVVDPAPGHRLAGVGRHLECAVRPGAGVVAQQELDCHRRRELGRAAESAVLLVVLTGQPEERPGELRLTRHALAALGEGALGEVADDARGDLADLVPAIGPGRRHSFEDLTEGGQAVPGIGREVRTEVEGFGVGGQEDGHRPPALAGRGLDRLHVHGVHVGSFLAVDLDVHEVIVHVRRRDLVLEGLVRHDVAPVARGVPHAQQDGHVAPSGLLESRGLPRPPVDRVVRVLKEVRGRGVRESIGHASILAHARACHLGATGGHRRCRIRDSRGSTQTWPLSVPGL